MATRRTPSAKKLSSRSASAPGARPAKRAPRIPKSPPLGTLEHRLRAQLASGESAAWKAGRLFDAIATQGLYSKAGFTTLEQYADARFPNQGFTTLELYRRVARQFTGRDVASYGVVKLDLARRYLRAMPARRRPKRLAALRIELDDGRRLSLAEISRDELERATQRLEASAGKPPKERSDEQRLPRGGAALRERFEAVLRRKQRDTIPQPVVSARVVRDDERSAIVLFTIEDLEAEVASQILEAIERRRR